MSCDLATSVHWPSRWVGAIAVSALLCACGQSEESAAPVVTTVPEIAVAIAELRAVQPSVELPAVVEALESSRLRPQFAATVTARYVTPGALVEEGDLLYEFDESDLGLAMSQAEAALQQAEASAAQAETDWERAQRLQAQGAISERDFERARAAFQTSDAQILELEARVERARLDLEDTRVRAPFAGKISIAYYAVGDYVTPTSAEPLCEIVRLDPIYVTAQVDQKLYYEFRLRRQELEAAGVELGPLRAGLILPTGQEYAHEGTFQSWDNTAVAETGTVGARAVFPNPQGLLLPGNNVILTGHVMDAIDRVVVPQRAVSQDQQGHYVMVVGDDGIVERQNVAMGLRIGADWAVRDGLQAGQRVVVDGLQVVRPGLEVNAQLVSNSQ